METNRERSGSDASDNTRSRNDDESSAVSQSKTEPLESKSRSLPNLDNNNNNKKKKKIPERKIKRYHRNWEKHYKLLVEHLALHGNTNDPNDETSAYSPSLRIWVNQQQNEYRKLRSPNKSSKLTAEQIQRLNDIGFDFRTERARRIWNERLEELRAFRREHGHARVSMSHPTLGTFVLALRRDYEEYRMGHPGSTMTEERLTELQQLDFEFEVTENTKQGLGDGGNGGVVGAGGGVDASGHKGAETTTSKQETQTMVSSSVLENTNDARLLQCNKRMLQNIQHESTTNPTEPDADGDRPPPKKPKPNESTAEIINIDSSESSK